LYMPPYKLAQMMKEVRKGLRRMLCPLLPLLLCRARRSRASPSSQRAATQPADAGVQKPHLPASHSASSRRPRTRRPRSTSA
jgi:hypothetical protein